MSGPKLQLVAASWTTAYSDERWAVLEGHKTETPFDVPDEQQSDWLALGPALPDETEDRVAIVVVHRHRGEAEGDGRSARLDWQLTVQPAPGGDPVEKIVSHNAKLGGRPGLMKLLTTAGAGGTPQVGRFLVRFVVEEAARRCKVLPVPLEQAGHHGPAATLGRGARLEQVGYRYESGAIGLEEVSIVYLHTERVFSVSVHANGSLRLGSTTWLPYANEVAELVLDSFFFDVDDAA